VIRSLTHSVSKYDLPLGMGEYFDLELDFDFHFGFES